MKSLQRPASLLALALLVLTPVAALASNAGDKGDEMKTTLIGQLSQDAAGGYVLVEQESGEQIRLEGTDELADHIGTEVKVTGEWADDIEGGKVFRVEKVEAAV